MDQTGRVQIDLLDVYCQPGVDVLTRLRAFNLAPVMGAIAFPVGAA